MLEIPMPQAHLRTELNAMAVPKSQLLKPLPSRVAKRKRRKKKKPVLKSKCWFENTEIGFLLKKYCIVEYNLIHNISKENHLKINAEIIERVSYASANPFFKSRTFRLALLNFRVNGWVKRAKNSLYDDELSAIKVKLKEMGLG